MITWHQLKWKQSRLNVRCWQCSEILAAISTDGSSKRDEDIADYLNEYRENDDLSKNGEKLFDQLI